MTVMYTCITAILPDNRCTLGALLSPVVRQHQNTHLFHLQLSEPTNNDIHRYIYLLCEKKLNSLVFIFVNGSLPVKKHPL